MTLEEAIADLTAKIVEASPKAVIRVTRASSEEAAIRAYAPADDETAIKGATTEQTIKLMMEEGLDIQVFVYDITTSLPSEE